MLQEVPDDLKARSENVVGEASLHGHLKAEGSEESGSQSYVPPDEKDDRALKEALDLLESDLLGAAEQARGQRFAAEAILGGLDGAVEDQRGDSVH